MQIWLHHVNISPSYEALITNKICLNALLQFALCILLRFLYQVHTNKHLQSQLF